MNSPAGGSGRDPSGVDPAGVCEMARAFALYPLDARTEIWPPLKLGLACGPADGPTRAGVPWPGARREPGRHRESLPVSGYRAGAMSASELPTPAPRTACSITSSARSHFPASPSRSRRVPSPSRRLFVLAVVIFCCCRSSVVVAVVVVVVLVLPLYCSLLTFFLLVLLDSAAGPPTIPGLHSWAVLTGFLAGRGRVVRRVAADHSSSKAQA